MFNKLEFQFLTGISKGYAFIEFESAKTAERICRKFTNVEIDGAKIVVDREVGRTLEGWVPRRLGGGWGGRKESGQLRFGCVDRPWRRPITANQGGNIASNQGVNITSNQGGNVEADEEFGGMKRRGDCRDRGKRKERDASRDERNSSREDRDSRKEGRNEDGGREDGYSGRDERNSRRENSRKEGRNEDGSRKEGRNEYGTREDGYSGRDDRSISADRKSKRHSRRKAQDANREGRHRKKEKVEESGNTSDSSKGEKKRD